LRSFKIYQLEMDTAQIDSVLSQMDEFISISVYNAGKVNKKYMINNNESILYFSCLFAYKKQNVSKAGISFKKKSIYVTKRKKVCSLTRNPSFRHTTAHPIVQ
jgi:hypothetical protein